MAARGVANRYAGFTPAQMAERLAARLELLAANA
jgi:hypothetical protein